MSLHVLEAWLGQPLSERVPCSLGPTLGLWQCLLQPAAFNAVVLTCTCCPSCTLLHAGNKIGGQTAALSCIYLVTAILSEMLTNNAAGAIMYPIASSAAESLGISPNIMSVAV